MNTLDRYIALTVGKAILLTLMALTLLTFVLTFIDQVEDVGKGDYELIHVLVFSLSTTPRFIYEAFPVSALIGALLGLGSLASHGELVAIRAAGRSLGHVLWAVLKGGFVLMLLVVVIGDVVAPVTEQYGQRLKLEKRNQQIAFSSKNGFWAKDGNKVVNIKQVSTGDQLKQVMIYQFAESGELEKATLAQEGAYEDGKWILNQVLESSISARGIEFERKNKLDFR